MPEIITSAKNPLIQQVRGLMARRREREADGLAVLEGVRLLEEALETEVTITVCLATAAAAARAREGAALARLQAAGVRTVTVAEGVLKSLADTRSPQGILAAFRPPRPRPWGPGPVLVADGLQDPGNLGTLVRAGAALGAGGIACPAGSTDPWAPKVVRAAAGGLFRLPIAAEGTVESVLAALSAAGRRIFLAEAAAGRPPWELDWSLPVAVILGSEGAGPSPAARAAADERVQIPMRPGAESLNAGVAGALLLYEAVRTRSRPDRQIGQPDRLGAPIPRVK